MEKLKYKYIIQEQNFHKKKGKLVLTFSQEYVLCFVNGDCFFNLHHSIKKKKPIAQIATQIEGKKMEYESKRDREKLPSMLLKTQSKYYAFER